ncbi:MAG: hypothetical protein AAGE52_14435 [Myxococcota bacterium]
MKRLSLVCAVLLLACSGSSRPSGRDGGGNVDAGDAGVGRDAAALDAAVARDAAVAEDVVVWAHSPRELYSFDPRTNLVTEVGAFRNAAGEDVADMTDLAVDGFGNLFTCSFDALFRVDPATAVVTEIGSFGIPTEVRFNALTFLPAGVLDPATEVLVAATAEGAYYRIDTSTATASLVGNFAPGYGSSGDVVSVLGAGTFAAASREGFDSDWLVRLDPVTGAVTPIGSTGTTRLFGLGYWRNRLFGFNSLGWLYEINIETGAANLVTNDTGARTFFGAGVTTNAPTAPI